MERTNAFVVKWQTRRNGDTFPERAPHGISMDTEKRCPLRYGSHWPIWTDPGVVIQPLNHFTPPHVVFLENRIFVENFGLNQTWDEKSI